MHRPVFLLAALLGCASPSFAEDPMMLRAGEWTMARDGQGGEAMKICYAADHPLGQLAGAGLSTCVQKRAVSRGTLLTITATCQVADMRVLVHGTIRPTGPGSYRADSRIRFEGSAVKAVSLGITARRLGPCQPGDAPG